MNQQAWHLIISGDVQGVGYRSFLKREAERLGVYGWVKNRNDGAVEAFIQGENKSIELLLGKIRQGPDVGWVRDVQAEEKPIHAQVTTFQVVY